MSRKLGRLLVVALVVAAVVGPATVSAAIDLPTCGGITYDPTNPSHILYPTDAGAIKEFFDHVDVWTDNKPYGYLDYLNVDLSGMAGPLVVFPDRDALTSATWATKFDAVRIVGTSGDDVICGYGDTVVRGGAGNDTIAGGTEAADFNVLAGGPGNDIILGDPEAFDGVLGGAGADVIYGAKTSAGPYPYVDNGDELYGGAGADTIFGGTGADYIGGQGGDDTIYGGAGSDEIVGGAGNDVIYGVLSGGYEDDADGGNELAGMAGDDTIVGGGSGDEIGGGAGKDTIRGNSGSDLIDGGLGDDTITGGVDADFLYGGPGSDTVYGGSGDDQVFGDGGAPYAPGHSFYGLEGTDTIYGDNDDDFLFGGLGADTLYGGLGIDELSGGYTFDTATCASKDYAADIMYGGYGSDRFFGAVGDLDRAYEDYEAQTFPLVDTANNVDIIPMGNVELVFYGPTVCV